MGQNHLIVNLTKREFLDPVSLGSGMRLMEFTGEAGPGVQSALMVLLASSNGRGGGDFHLGADIGRDVIGRWAGDQIAIVGDAATDNDLALEHQASKIYGRCVGDEQKTREGYTDVSPLVRSVLEREFDCTYKVTYRNEWQHSDGSKETYEAGRFVSNRRKARYAD